jgi:recombination protein RecR
MHYPDHLLKLIQALKKFPGVGNKSAERFAFHILNWPEKQHEELASLLCDIKQKLRYCDDCGCLGGEVLCYFCQSPQRNKQILCVIASPRDVYAIEETHEYKGLYHVLGGVLSPMDNRGPERLSIDQLKKRVSLHQIEEVVLALDSTLEGDATALYIKKALEAFPLQVSRLAFGLPMGSALDYVDGGTLARAFAGRNHF